MMGLFSKQYQDITPVAASTRDDLFRVDVREPHELVSELGAVAGARNVPLGSVLKTGLPDVPKDTPLLVICRSGGRSGRAAAALTQMGYGEVYNMAGGMIAWKDARLPRA